ncbi:hypothetical protein [Kribbella sp. NPDC051718]|uniref:hypothetical protein n=1 Tax=Kribbella sp. NPDC051718 TaxID=3155168 RepID=UPI0034490D7D
MIPMLANSAALLILAMIIGTLLVSYWKQIIRCLAIITTTVLCFGLLELIALFNN